MLNRLSSSEAIQRLAWVGTLLFAITAFGAVISDAVPVVATAVTVSLGLFAVGLVAFGFGFLRAAVRSRTEIIDLPGMFALSGSAPKHVQRSLMGAIGAQTTIAFVTAFLQPLRELAFGMFVPVFGLGLVTLWAAKHGEFAPREDEKRPNAASSSTLAREQSEHHESSD